MAKKFEMGDYLKTLAQPVSNSDTALFLPLALQAEHEGE